MFRPIIPVAALAGLALAACGDDPDRTPVAPGVTTPAIEVSPETARLEGTARRLARALDDPDFRARLHARLKASKFPESKIHLQRSYGIDNRSELSAIARLNDEPEARVDSAFRAAPALEVYLPVPEHRARWRGDRDLLVATAANDGDLPVAFDLKGGRHLLDPTRPPQTPVLAVVPVETNFDVPPPVGPQATCSGESCSGSGGGGSVTQIPGLYMTRAHFVQDFEGIEISLPICQSGLLPDSDRRPICAIPR